MKSGPPISPRDRGFTLVELLVSTGVLAVLLLVTMTALDSMQRSWSRTRGKVEQFRGARTAFEAITRNLTQATLNTYWDYHYSATQSNVPPAGAAAPPAGYVRQSELEFRVAPAQELGAATAAAAEHPGHGLFFQAPLGLSRTYRGLGSLLNARGYYVRFGSDEAQRPAFLPAGVVPVRHRFRLLEYRPPAEQVQDAQTPLQGNAIYTRPDWVSQNLAAASRPIADNILLLLVSPQVPEESLTGTGKKPWWLAPAYRYSSRDPNNATPQIDEVTVSAAGTVLQGTRHLLPPLVRVTLVAGEEGTQARWLAQRGQEPPDLLEEAGAPFSEAQHYDRDLGRLKQYLTEQRLNFRVFTATVALRNAVWDSTTF